MHATLLLVGTLAGSALAAPRPVFGPNNIDYESIVDAGPPTETASAFTKTASSVSVSTTTATPFSNSTKSALLAKKDLDDPCSDQPMGYGPKPATDSVDAFMSFTGFSDILYNAHSPLYYRTIFQNLQAAVIDVPYIGYSTMDSYSTTGCQKICDGNNACAAFNIFFERDPVVNPNTAEGCPNPSSTTNIKCALFGASFTSDNAINTGEIRAQFKVAIAGSNAYLKSPAPGIFSGFDNPVALGGSTKAPNYIGYDYLQNTYDASGCAATCQAITRDNRNNTDPGSSYTPCNFFNSYQFTFNDTGYGTICAYFSTPSGPEAGTYTGDRRGSDWYGITDSYGYTLDPQDSGIRTN